MEPPYIPSRHPQFYCPRSLRMIRLSDLPLDKINSIPQPLLQPYSFFSAASSSGIRGTPPPPGRLLSWIPTWYSTYPLFPTSAPPPTARHSKSHGHGSRDSVAVLDRPAQAAATVQQCRAAYLARPSLVLDLTTFKGSSVQPWRTSEEAQEPARFGTELRKLSRSTKPT